MFKTAKTRCTLAGVTHVKAVAFLKATRKSPVLKSVSVACLGQVPSREHARGNPTLMFLSLSPPLSKNKIFKTERLFFQAVQRLIAYTSTSFPLPGWVTTITRFLGIFSVFLPSLEEEVATVVTCHLQQVCFPGAFREG